MNRRKPGLRARLIFWSTVTFLAMGSLYLVPGLSFYFLFQRRVLAIEEGQGDGALLATRAEIGTDKGSDPKVPGRPWTPVAFGDWRVFLPPERVSMRREGETLIVKYHAGQITVDRFAPGFVREAFLGALGRTGGSVDSIPSRYGDADDGLLLHDLARVTTGDFQMGMKPLDRSIYAASIVAKMYIWDFTAVEQFRLLERDGQRGAYIRGLDGEASLLVCLPAGVFMYRLDGLPVAEHRPDHPSWFAATEHRPESR